METEQPLITTKPAKKQIQDSSFKTKHVKKGPYCYYSPQNQQK